MKQELLSLVRSHILALSSTVSQRAMIAREFGMQRTGVDPQTLSKKLYAERNQSQAKALSKSKAAIQ